MAVCSACRGQKKIQGLGFMGEIDCKRCKGIGKEPVNEEFRTEVIKVSESEVLTIQSIEVTNPIKEIMDEAQKEFASEITIDQGKPDGFFKRAYNKKSKPQVSN